MSNLFDKIKNRLFPKLCYPYRVSGNLKFLFIHINKTGGSSIIKTIWPQHKWHDTAKEIIKVIGEKNYRETYKFTVVRNPWSKVVSQYKFRTMHNQNSMNDNPISFKDWVLLTYGETKDQYYYDDPKMFQQQVEWLKDNNEVISIDKIIKFENLVADFEEVANHLKINKKLPVNKLKKLFDFSYHTKRINIIFKRSLKK